ncbi:MAG: endonuclease, partial [Candidatus Aenigmarchaeota archaeon]|nr:endonuclease [Candidatus Aenigmarchaeota archaeon]
LEYIVGGFPYIDKVLAQRILVRFGDIKTFINASYEDLLEVEGIGPEKAKKIVEIIKAKYTLDKDEIC